VKYIEKLVKTYEQIIEKTVLDTSELLDSNSFKMYISMICALHWFDTIECLDITTAAMPMAGF
jgi:hypothetical protein